MKKMLKAPFVRRITKKLSDDEREMIDSAEMPELKEVTPEQLAKARGSNNQNVKVMLQGILIFGAMTIPAFLMKKYKFGAALLLTLVVFLIAAFIMHLRSNIDETAVVTEIPVHHTERRLTGGKAVCYLPDGKYLFPYSSKLPQPESVSVVRCGRTAFCLFNRKDVKS